MEDAIYQSAWSAHLKSYARWSPVHTTQGRTKGKIHLSSLSGLLCCNADNLLMCTDEIIHHQREEIEYMREQLHVQVLPQSVTVDVPALLKIVLQGNAES